jgi:membrane protein DedA with SNARE-associated domain
MLANIITIVIGVVLGVLIVDALVYWIGRPFRR